MLIESFAETIRKVEFLYYNNVARNHERGIGFFFFAVKGQVLKILNRNKTLTSVKGYNSVTNMQNIEDKFGEILSICPQDIEQKQNSVANQGP